MTQRQIDRFVMDAKIFFPEESEVIVAVDVSRKVQ
jgi:hypothetical protein